MEVVSSYKVVFPIELLLITYSAYTWPTLYFLNNQSVLNGRSPAPALE